MINTKHFNEKNYTHARIFVPKTSSYNLSKLGEKDPFLCYNIKIIMSSNRNKNKLVGVF